jgi:tetratricopeptide (TPR) repeat protein
LGIAVLVALARRPSLGFLGAWFIITLAPTTSVVPIVTEVGAERRMYLPLAGLAVLGVVAWYALTGARRNPAIIAGIIVCALLGTGTLLRNREYESRLSIAQTIVDRWPSGRGQYVLAIELLRAGRRDEALAELRASARDYPDAHYALGTELFADGRLDAAVAELRAFVQALPMHPNVVPARDQLGRAFLSQGRIDDALREFDFVLTQPDYRNRAEVVELVDEIQSERRARP